ncbi:Saccharopine dehydrogenase-like oxidoreductase [Halotydeus destructor]|nr:Saccharopine dehydrogenase-like oxidoreductase [Halotydeus destructor]
MAQEERGEFDIVIYGATGSVGRFAIENLAKCNEEQNLDLKWAVAGRNKDKLRKILDSVGSKVNLDLSAIGIIEADGSDEDSLLTMARKANVLVNLVGPYRTLGEAVVRACVLTGAHYVDIMGDPYSMVLKFQDRAQQSGSVIIPCCGYGALIPELVVPFMRTKFDGTLLGVSSYSKIIPSAQGYVIGHGTWDTILDVAGHLRQALKTKSSMMNTFKKRIPNLTHKVPLRYMPHRPPLSDSYFSILASSSDMQMSDITILYNYNEKNERPIYHEKYVVFASVCTLFRISVMLILMAPFIWFKWSRNVLLKHPAFFSLGLFKNEGPTEEQIAGTTFEVTLKAIGWQERFTGSIDEQPASAPDKTMYGRITGPEPTYRSTGICAVQSAITLVEESKKFENGGVLTPGSAFAGTGIIERLEKCGIKFDIVS